jgi:DNA-binding FadR family transcriptional regulator
MLAHELLILNIKTMADLYQVREALEGMACRIAATSVNNEVNLGQQTNG